MIEHHDQIEHYTKHVVQRWALVQVIRNFWGRKGAKAKMPELLSMFIAHTVLPCTECEPGHGLKESYLNRLVDFLACEEGTSATDLELVRQICTGKLQRHPAVHGVASL